MPGCGSRDGPASRPEPAAVVPAAEPDPWRERLDRLELSRADDLEAFAAGLRELLAELSAALAEPDPARPEADLDAAALALSRAVGLAFYAGLPDVRSVDAIDELATPVLRRGPPRAAGSLAYLLAWVAVDEGRIARAIDVLEECAARFPDDELTVLERGSLLAQFLAQTGRIEDSLALLDRTISHAERDGRHDMLAQLYGTRAQIGFDNGLFDRAYRELERAARHAELAGDPQQAFEIYTLRLDQGLGLGRFDRVVRATEDVEAYGPDAAATIRVYRAFALRNLAGRTDEADELLASALADERLPAELRREAMQMRVLIALDRGDLDGAESHLTELDAESPLSVERFDRDRADLADFDHAALSTRVALATGASDLAACAELHEAAFRALLRRWDALNLRDGGVGRLMLDRWRRVVGELARLRLALAGDTAAGRQRAFDVALAVQARASLARALAAERPTAGAVRAALGAGHGVLVYLPAARETLVFALDAEELVVGQTVRKGDLEILVRELTPLLDAGRERDRRCDDLAVELAELAFPHDVAERMARWSGMTVVGADLVGDPPIEVLELPGADAGADAGAVGAPRTLGERLAIDHCESLGAWLRLATVGDPGGGRTSFWGTLQPASPRVTEPARTFAVRHVDMLREACAQHPLDVDLDGAFTVGALLRADLSGVACLHLLAHGIWDDAREIGAVLAVAGDDTDPLGIVSADVIRRLPRVPPVVLLSACRAASAHPRRGDGHYNTLAGAFLRAGARAVVLSGGDLRLEEHMTLAAAFHAARNGGATVAEALRRARLALAQGSRSPRLLREIRLQAIGNGQVR